MSPISPSKPPLGGIPKRVAGATSCRTTEEVLVTLDLKVIVDLSAASGRISKDSAEAIQILILWWTDQGH